MTSRRGSRLLCWKFSISFYYLLFLSTIYYFLIRLPICFHSLLAEADDAGDIAEEAERAEQKDEHSARPEPGQEPVIDMMKSTFMLV